MIKKDITYKNLDGVEVTETFYFNISMNDILEKAVDEEQVANLKKIADGGNNPLIMRTFTELIGASVGRRSELGMGILKTKEFSAEFMDSDAYSVLMWQILTDAKLAAEFINGIFPADLAAKLAARQSGTLELSEPPTPKKPEQYTHAELMAMDSTSFNELMKALPGNNVPKTFLIAGMQRQHEAK